MHATPGRGAGVTSMKPKTHRKLFSLLATTAVLFGVASAYYHSLGAAAGTAFLQAFVLFICSTLLTLIVAMIRPKAEPDPALLSPGAAAWTGESHPPEPPTSLGEPQTRRGGGRSVPEAAARYWRMRYHEEHAALDRLWSLYETTEEEVKQLRGDESPESPATDEGPTPPAHGSDESPASLAARMRTPPA